MDGRNGTRNWALIGNDASSVRSLVLVGKEKGSSPCNSSKGTVAMEVAL